MHLKQSKQNLSPLETDELIVMCFPFYLAHVISTVCDVVQYTSRPQWFYVNPAYIYMCVCACARISSFK